MSDDMLQYAQVSPGVGEPTGADLVELAQVAPVVPNKKERHRPNNGRKKRSDKLRPHLSEPPWHLLRATGYPLPPDLKVLQGITPRYWRQGPRADRWRKKVFEMWGRTCHLCNHPGADSADHLVPLAVWVNQPYDPRISRPAHGVAGCPTCKVKCNSSRGHRALAITIGNYKPPVGL